MDGDDPLDGAGGARPQRDAAGGADAANPIGAGRLAVAAPGLVPHPDPWREAVRLDYVYGDLSIARIARKHGTSAKSVTTYAKQGKWVRLVGTKPLKPGRKPGMSPRRQAAISETRRRDLLRRLYQVIDHRLAILEARMSEADDDDTPANAADRERHLREVTTLMQLGMKIAALDKAAEAKAADKGSAPVPTARSGDDADKLRRDLTLRLERLNRQGND